ncbi:MAG: outer membrane protein [Gammaproteobacteria bacterium]
MRTLNRLFYVIFLTLCLFSFTSQVVHAKKSKSHHYKKSYKGDYYKGAAVSLNENGWFFGLGGGAAWTHVGHSSTTVPNGSDTPPPTNVDAYSITNPKVVANMQLMLGYRWHIENLCYLPYLSLYLQYRHNFNANLHGTIEQYSLPDFLNYRYRMNYDSDLITLNGKFDLVEFYHIMPYLAGGLGVIINHLNNYNETAFVGVTPRTSPHFNGISTTNFAGTLGAGLDFILTKNLWLTLGYEHVFVSGHLKSGSGTAAWSGTTLNFGNVRTDNVFLSLTANFPQALWS